MGLITIQCSSSACTCTHIPTQLLSLYILMTKVKTCGEFCHLKCNSHASAIKTKLVLVYTVHIILSSKNTATYAAKDMHTVHLSEWERAHLVLQRAHIWWPHTVYHFMLPFKAIFIQYTLVRYRQM